MRKRHTGVAISKMCLLKKYYCIKIAALDQENLRRYIKIEKFVFLKEKIEYTTEKYQLLIHPENIIDSLRG